MSATPARFEVDGPALHATFRRSTRDTGYWHLASYRGDSHVAVVVQLDCPFSWAAETRGWRQRWHDWRCEGTPFWTISRVIEANGGGRWTWNP